MNESCDLLVPDYMISHWKNYFDFHLDFVKGPWQFLDELNFQAVVPVLNPA